MSTQNSLPIKVVNKDGTPISGSSASVKTYATDQSGDDSAIKFAKVGQTGDAIENSDFIQVIAGRDSSNQLRPVRTDSNGAIQIDLDGVSVTANNLNVDVRHNEGDSVLIGDGTNTVTISTDGSKQALDVHIADEDSPSIIRNGQINVTTAGTAVALTTSTPVKAVVIQALPSNSGIIYVGDSSVSSSTGYPLEAGQSIGLAIDDLQKVYIDSNTDGDGVAFLGS